jgi:hypothetical protein
MDNQNPKSGQQGQGDKRHEGTKPERGSEGTQPGGQKQNQGGQQQGNKGQQGGQNR